MAGALVLDRNASVVGHAIIGVGATITTTNGIVQLITALWDSSAGAGGISATAVCCGREVAEFVCATSLSAACTTDLTAWVALARALVVDGDASGVCVAIIGVGLAITATDWLVLVGAHLRFHLACTGTIGATTV